MDALGFEFRLMGSSNLAINRETERILQCAAQIEEKFKELKQKNDKLSGYSNAGHIKEYLNKIEFLFQQISNCLKDIRKTVSEWRKEKDMLEKNANLLAVKIESQNQFNDNIENRRFFYYFLLCPDFFMDEWNTWQPKIVDMLKEIDKRWDSFMNEYGQEFDRLGKHKDKVVHILNSNWKYLCRREEVNRQNDYVDQPSPKDEIIPYHKRLKEKRNADIEDVFRSISLLRETTHKSIAEVKLQVEGCFIPWFGSFCTRIEETIRPLNPTKEDIEMRLLEFCGIWEEIYHDSLPNSNDMIENCKFHMSKLEEKAKALALNPLNIQIGGFRQVKDQCLGMMNLQEDKTRDHKLKWNRYVKHNKTYIEKLIQVNKWMNSMPHDAIKLFKEVYDRAQQTSESTKKLSCINETIDLCQKDASALEDKIEALRNKMVDIESMMGNPRIFALESMIPENITRVFSELEKWNEMYESLKETIKLWDEKTKGLENSMKQWETIVHERSEDSVRGLQGVFAHGGVETG